MIIIKIIIMYVYYIQKWPLGHFLAGILKNVCDDTFQQATGKAVN